MYVCITRLCALCLFHIPCFYVRYALTPGMFNFLYTSEPVGNVRMAAGKWSALFNIHFYHKEIKL